METMNLRLVARSKKTMNTMCDPIVDGREEERAVDADFLKINRKTVQVGKPYLVGPTAMIGRVQELRKVLASWMRGHSGLPLSPLLVSEPGIGKNRIIYEAARVCGKELFVFQGHEEVSSEDLTCSVRFSDDPGKRMDYILSPLASAMVRGNAVCFIDEIAKIRPRALAPLASLLDERRYIDSNILGERIHASPGFRFIAATNSIDLEGGMLPDFIRSRLRPVISVGFPDREEIDRIVTSRFSVLNGNGPDLLEAFWRLWRKKCGDRPPTPRDSISIFAYAINLADYAATCEQGRQGELEGCRGSGAIAGEHLEQAFAAFHDGLDAET